ncbi:hypothetical protein H072_10636 [Dactylellina haptotyla CBS 200.50]|uniref:VOC domain-containing protein n=1 Tax=Dactylellina haptotyla (strain CBS 200.50) TaxID=1284197 RepID=S8BA01_DACHA|nr:hypothetical protein H072_10636 [Dactylellina haptotyla CBS 200.50]
MEAKSPTTTQDAPDRMHDPPTANSGKTVPAVQAMKGIEHVSPDRWTSAASTPKIRITKLSHMRYRQPASNMDNLVTFLLDFGMEIVKRTENAIWFGGYGIDQYIYYCEIGQEKEFLGGTWEVKTFEDLERAAKLGNSNIVELKDAPGGGRYSLIRNEDNQINFANKSSGQGKLVTIHDPEGFPVNFIHGATPRARPIKQPTEALQVNDEFSKPRKGAFQRFQPGPAAIHKLGHFGLTIHDFELQFRWYTTNFNLVPSDMLYVPDTDGNKVDVAAFLHVDKGKAYSDHHSFFFSVAKDKHVHHSSYEVHDYDSQNMGHYWLKEKGYNPVWGLGRHKLGSQIFDYWWDPNGFMVEHYIDGDLVNEDTPTGRQLAGDESLAVWSEPVPSTFLD